MPEMQFPLTSLIERLRSTNIRVSVSQVADIQKILFLSHDLKYTDLPGIITPILSTNPTDQKIIETECKRYINSLFIKEDVTITNVTKQQKSYIANFRKWLWKIYKYIEKRKRTIYPVAICITVLVLLYHFIPSENNEVVADVNSLSIYYLPQQIIVNDTVRFALGRNPTGKGKYLKWNFYDLTSGSDITGEFANLSLRLNDTIKKVFTMASNVRATLEIDDSIYAYINQEEMKFEVREQTDLETNYVIKTSIKVYVLICLLVFFIGFYIFFKYYYVKRLKTKAIKTTIQIDNTKYKSAPYEIAFPDMNYLLTIGIGEKRISNSLLQKEQMDAQVLNIPQSVIATSKNAGYPTTIMKNQVRHREFLIVIETRAENDHLYNLFNWFCDNLSQSGIFVEKYIYYPGHDEIISSNGRSRKLEKLLQEKIDYNLVIFGEGSGLTENLKLKIKENFTTALNCFDTKIIITPVVQSNWTAREPTLVKAGFIVIPADMESINLAAENIARKDPISWKTPDFLRDKKNSPRILNFEDLTVLQHYLENETLFQILCALAVYPRLDWSLTVKLIHAIAEFYKKENDPKKYFEIDYAVLLKLSRINWLQTGILKDNLRVKLLNNLNPVIQAIVRENILEILAIIKQDLPENAIANVEMEVQTTINSFALYTYNPKKFSRFESFKKDIASQWDSITDWPFLQNIKYSSTSLFNNNLNNNSIKVEDYIFPDRKATLRKNIIFTLVIFVVVAIVIMLPNSPVKKILPSTMLTYEPPVPPVPQATSADSTAAVTDTATTSTPTTPDTTSKMADSARPKTRDSTKK